MTLPDGELETAVEMAAAVRAGDVEAAELVERSLARIERWQPVTNAFSQVWGDEALAATAAVGPGPGGPLAGVPMAVKDLFDVAGHETTGCCRAYAGNVAAQDAPTVTAVRRAGAVLVGKTNQHELAAGGTSAVSACGPARNPWAPDRITGGSSGGSGAAVAAGVVPVALGSDTGGSVRIPASMCGTFGLKPTTGRLPVEGLLPLAPSMDCPGPMAASLEDLWMLAGAMSGRDPGPPPTPDARPDGRPLCVGVVGGHFTDRTHPEAVAAARSAASVLEGAAVGVVLVDGDGIEDGREVWMRVCCAEFAQAHRGIDRSLVAPSVLRWMEDGDRSSAEEIANGVRRRNEIARWFRDRLADLDALVVPTTPYSAPRLGDEWVDLGPHDRVPIETVGPGYLSCVISLSGLPALSLPAARTAEGLPIGASLVGGEDDEAALFRLASVWQAATAYRPDRPSPPAA